MDDLLLMKELVNILLSTATFLRTLTENGAQNVETVLDISFLPVLKFAEVFDVWSAVKFDAAVLEGGGGGGLGFQILCNGTAMISAGAGGGGGIAVKSSYSPAAASNNVTRNAGYKMHDYESCLR